MKKRKKIVSRLLCAALITATLPIGTPAVYAAEAAGTPSRTAYADKTGLQENYDLSKDTEEDKKSVQKVYFGYAGDGDSANKTPQVWKIAGKDNEIKDGDGNTIDNIVLFADSAIKPLNGDADGKIQFDKDWDYTKSTQKPYPTNPTELAALGITYTQKDYTPEWVNVSHYGTSTLRDVLRKMAKSTDYFTTAQQKLMNETTITTEDTRNKENGKYKTYTTTDILYAAYGDSNDTDEKDQYIHVGTNKETDDSLNNGLKIDRVINDVNIWEKDNKTFWLRAPVDSSLISALVADPDYSVTADNSRVDFFNSVVPAFDLNLTNVLFASFAPAVAKTEVKNLSGNDAMTFRWADKEGNDAKIKSTATWNEDGVGVINKDGNEDVFLCVQGNNGGTDWIWSQKVSDVTSPISDDSIADDIKAPTSLADPKVELAQCKIWLETTDTNEDLTYAKEVKEGNFVSITAGTGLEITSGNAAQTVNKGEPISDIIFNVKNTHYLENTDDFIKTINDELIPSGNPSGLKAKRAATGTGFTISGKPIRDVTIELPAAKAKPKAPKPTLSESNIKITKNSLTIQTDGFDTATYGAIQYRCQQADANKNTRAVDWTEGTEISGLQAGTAYTIAIRYKGAGIYLPSEPSELTISTLEETGNTDTDSSGQDGSDPNTDNEITGSGKNQSNTAGPRTGDNNSIALWLVLMLVSLAGVAAAFYGRSKKVK